MERILVIDDDPDMLEIFDLTFGREGYNMVASTNGNLINHIAEYHPNLIMLDVHLENQPRNGMELCQELKSTAAARHIPIILYSYDLEVEQMADDCGADDFLQKPFGLNALRSKVKAYLS